MRERSKFLRLASHLSILTLLLAAGAPVLAQSQPPTPARADTNGDAQDQREGQADISNEHEAVSAPPVSVNVGVFPSVVADAKDDQETGNSGNSAADWWTVALTAVIAVATITLAVIGGRQLRTQASQTERSLQLSRRALKLNRRAHAATEIAHAKTEALATESLQQSRKAFALTNRPRLVVRRVVLTSDTRNHPPAVQAYVDVCNIGNIPARLVGIQAVVLISRDRPLPAEAPWEGSTTGLGLMSFKRIEPGETYRHHFESQPLNDDAGLDLSVAMANDDAHIRALGRFQYSDETIGITREIGFSRKFNYNSRRCEPLGDPDYEYAD
ncbi:MAG: hypothetical protein AB7H88_21980 [Vicinamibacterales bacterium]